MSLNDAIESALKMIQQSGRGPTVIYYGRDWAIAMRDGGHDPEGKFLAAYDEACPDGGLCAQTDHATHGILEPRA